MINNKNQYIAVIAKALAPSQKNYPATNCEFLEIVWALIKLGDYIYGRKVIVFIQKQANYMVANWADILLDYDLEIVHRPGITMILPDALSRLFCNLGEDKEQAL